MVHAIRQFSFYWIFVLLNLIGVRRKKYWKGWRKVHVMINWMLVPYLSHTLRILNFLKAYRPNSSHWDLNSSSPKAQSWAGSSQPRDATDSALADTTKEAVCPGSCTTSRSDELHPSSLSFVEMPLLLACKNCNRYLNVSVSFLVQ